MESVRSVFADETPKYELLETDRVEIGGRILRRIRAVRDFGDVRNGDKGGYVESHKNLSHAGRCWISGDAMAFEEAIVSEDARMSGASMMFGRALLSGAAELAEMARVFDDAWVRDKAHVRGKAVVKEFGRVTDLAYVGGEAVITGEVGGTRKVDGKGEVRRPVALAPRSAAINAL